ncbi:MAG: cyclase family protein, partial [Acidobacteria bacterium]|nr:cyclase family protein [Acidobacteriota bacterium]
MKLSRFVVITHVLLLTAMAPVIVCRSSKNLTSKDVDRMMTSLSNWGRWGADDQLGTINLITAEKRKQAAALVQEGFSVSMAHDAIKVEQDGSPPFEHKMLPESFKPDSVGANDRFAVSYHGFTTTHMDALCHFFYQGKMYNGFSRDEVTRSGAGKLSVHTMKDGIFTRAVLMDMPRLWDVDYLPG